MSYTDRRMRTSIEPNREHRARLLDLAARRGLKGFSAIVQEVLHLYLIKASAKSRRGVAVQQFRGCLSKREAHRFRAVATRLRTSWR